MFTLRSNYYFTKAVLVVLALIKGRLIVNLFGISAVGYLGLVISVLDFLSVAAMMGRDVAALKHKEEREEFLCKRSFVRVFLIGILLAYIFLVTAFFVDEISAIVPLLAVLIIPYHFNRSSLMVLRLAREHQKIQLSTILFQLCMVVILVIVSLFELEATVDITLVLVLLPVALINFALVRPLANSVNDFKLFRVRQVNYGILQLLSVGSNLALKGILLYYLGTNRFGEYMAVMGLVLASQGIIQSKISSDLSINLSMVDDRARRQVLKEERKTATKFAGLALLGAVAVGRLVLELVYSVDDVRVYIFFILLMVHQIIRVFTYVEGVYIFQILGSKGYSQFDFVMQTLRLIFISVGLFVSGDLIILGLSLILYELLYGWFVIKIGRRSHALGA